MNLKDTDGTWRLTVLFDNGTSAEVLGEYDNLCTVKKAWQEFIVCQDGDPKLVKPSERFMDVYGMSDSFDRAECILSLDMMVVMSLSLMRVY